MSSLTLVVCCRRQMWATNFTQDLLSKTTGGPVIQGPLAAMNNATAW